MDHFYRELSHILETCGIVNPMVREMIIDILFEDEEELGRGYGCRASQLPKTRIDYAATFDEFPEKYFKSIFRFSHDELEDIILDATTLLNLPVVSRLGVAGKYSREHCVSLRDRVYICIEHIVRPEKSSYEFSYHLGVSEATISNIFRNDIPRLIQSLNGECLRNNEFVISLQDTTTSQTQRMVSCKDTHHGVWGLRTIAYLDKYGNILGFETGYGGAESDLHSWVNGDIYQSLLPYIGERKVFMGDGVFRGLHCVFPLNINEIAGNPNLQIYNEAIKLHRTFVEISIFHAKNRFGALVQIPGLSHHPIEQLTNMIALGWLLEARFQRVHD